MKMRHPHELENTIGMKSSSGETVALKAVDITGRVEGLLFEKTVNQRYRNDSGKTLEIVYTFPLAYGETLIAMTVDIDGKRLNAQVLERKEAAEKYEKAIESGDTPVLVDLAADGLATANLGNIKAGAEVTVEIRSATLLNFAQGQLRLSLPMTIAPRYGDPVTDGGLREVDAVDVDPLAAYPLTLKIELCGAAGKAAVSSPSHRLTLQNADAITTITPTETAYLDRDFILVLDGLAETSTALLARDGSSEGNEYTAQATFYPPVAHSDTPAPIALKILVDCSGSMSGDSIQTAKRALRQIAAELGEHDRVTYSCFGSDVVHHFRCLRPCSDATRRTLATAINETDANLGGTEMEKALLGVFQLGNDDGEDDGNGNNRAATRVLLITDGEVWNTEQIQRTAQKSGHTVFAIAIGSSAAEHLLRHLAEDTGGAYEAIAPNEAGAQAIARMFYRMRGNEIQALKMDWSEKPRWQSALPPGMYRGETLHVFAQFAADEKPARAPTLSYRDADGTTKTLTATLTPTESAIVPRLGGMRRQAETDDREDALALALKYQLLTPQTALFLVYEQAEKLTEAPTLHKVSQMMAAGWGGVGSAAISGVVSRSFCAPMHENVDHFLHAKSLPAHKPPLLDSGEPRLMMCRRRDSAAHKPPLLDFGKDEARVYVRPGQSESILIDLRKGHWKIEAELDLSGRNSERAKLALTRFLDRESPNRLLRALVPIVPIPSQRARCCVRIIYDDLFASPDGLLDWLTQHRKVLAFCPDDSYSSGSALLVLLE
jgi:Ca-activated chloride channel family protein